MDWKSYLKIKTTFLVLSRSLLWLQQPWKNLLNLLFNFCKASSVQDTFAHMAVSSPQTTSATLRRLLCVFHPLAGWQWPALWDTPLGTGGRRLETSWACCPEGPCWQDSWEKITSLGEYSPAPFFPLSPFLPPISWLLFDILPAMSCSSLQKPISWPINVNNMGKNFRISNAVAFEYLANLGKEFTYLERCNIWISQQTWHHWNSSRLLQQTAHSFSWHKSATNNLTNKLPNYNTSYL